MLFNIPSISQETDIENKSAPSIDFSDDTPCFSNLSQTSQSTAVEMICAYIQKSFYSKRLGIDATTISPDEYIKAAQIKTQNSLKDSIIGDFDNNPTLLLAIKLAHNTLHSMKEELSSTVFNLALHITAYVKDYERLKTLIDEKYTYKRERTKIFFAIEEKDDKIIFQAMHYAKHGYDEGLKNLLKDSGEQTWFIEHLKRMLAKAARHGHINIVSFLLDDKKEVFSKDSLEDAFHETTNSEIINLLLKKPGTKLSEDGVARVFQMNIAFSKYNASCFLEAFSRLLDETLSDQALDSIFLHIKKHSNQIMEIFIKKKEAYILERADDLFPLFIKTGQSDGVNLLLKEKKDILKGFPLKHILELLDKAPSKQSMDITTNLVKKIIHTSSDDDITTLFSVTLKKGHPEAAKILLTYKPEFAQKFPLKIEGFTSQELSNTLYTLGLLELKPPVAFLDGWGNASLKKMEYFTSQDLSNIIYALGLLSLKPSEVFLNSWIHSTMQSMDYFNPQELSRSIYALGILGIKPPAAFLDAWMNVILYRLDTFSTKDLINCMYVLGILEIQPSKDFLKAWGDAAIQKIGTLNPQDLSKDIYSFGRLKLMPSEISLNKWKLEKKDIEIALLQSAYFFFQSGNKNNDTFEPLQIPPLSFQPKKKGNDSVTSHRDITEDNAKKSPRFNFY